MAESDNKGLPIIKAAYGGAILVLTAICAWMAVLTAEDRHTGITMTVLIVAAAALLLLLNGSSIYINWKDAARAKKLRGDITALKIDHEQDIASLEQRHKQNQDAVSKQLSKALTELELLDGRIVARDSEIHDVKRQLDNAVIEKNKAEREMEVLKSFSPSGAPKEIGVPDIVENTAVDALNLWITNNFSELELKDSILYLNARRLLGEPPVAPLPGFKRMRLTANNDGLPYKEARRFQILEFTDHSNPPQFKSYTHAVDLPATGLWQVDLELRWTGGFTKFTKCFKWNGIGLPEFVECPRQ